MLGRRKRKDARPIDAILASPIETLLAPPVPANAEPRVPSAAAPPAPAAPTPPVPAAAPPAPAAPAVPPPLTPADIRARAVLADAIARMELRLAQEPEPPKRLAPPTGAAVETLRDSVAESSTEVTRALEQIASMCATIADRLEADGAERRALTEAVARLAESTSTPLDVPASVLGGTVFAPAVSRESDISIVEDDERVPEQPFDANDFHYPEPSRPAYGETA